MDRVAWKELALLGFTGTLSARRAKNNECNLISRSTSCAQAASARHRNISCIIAKDCPPAALSRAVSAARSAKLIGIDPSHPAMTRAYVRTLRRLREGGAPNVRRKT